jgi:hypothetical protein
METKIKPTKMKLFFTQTKQIERQCVLNLTGDQLLQVKEELLNRGFTGEQDPTYEVMEILTEMGLFHEEQPTLDDDFENNEEVFYQYRLPAKEMFSINWYKDELGGMWDDEPQLYYRYSEDKMRIHYRPKWYVNKGDREGIFSDYGVVLDLQQLGYEVKPLTHPTAERYNWLYKEVEGLNHKWNRGEITTQKYNKQKAPLLAEMNQLYGELFPETIF